MSTLRKQEVRRLFYARREKISPEGRKKASHAVVTRLISENIFKQSRHIACYLPFRDEFDSLPLIHAIWQHEKICYLPILTETKSLVFAQYDEGDQLIANRYAIFEPQNTLRKIPAEKLDLAITPLVAFDLKGHRVGTGGGYYDRTFAFLHEHSLEKPLLMGLAYALQRAEDLPYDPWDINLHAVMTEEGLWCCSSSV